MESKKILFISNIYLPQKNGGIQRICKFFEGLNKKPLETFLITTNDYCGVNSNEKNVFRVHDLYQFLKTMKNEKRVKKLIKKGGYDFFSIIKKYIFLFFCFPDEHFTFIFFAFFQAITIIKRNKPDYIVSTYPSVTNLVTGWIISLVFNKKHIVDLRETWLNTPDWSMKYKNTFAVRTRIKVENFLEGKIINNSHLVILNNKWMKDLYEKKYGNGHKYKVIPNGFDEDIIRIIKRKKNSNEKIKIIYAGSYYLKHQPDYIFEGIKKATKKYPELKNNIEFNIFGIIDEKTDDLIEKYSAYFSIKYFSYLKKEKIFQLIADSDLGIVTFPPIEWSIGKIPGKIYEYKKIGVNMLSIGEKNSALQHLSEELKEKFIYAKDVESIADYFIDFFKNTKNGNLVNSKDEDDIINEYDYDKIINRLRRLFI